MAATAEKSDDRIRYTLKFLCAIRDREASVRPEALSLNSSKGTSQTVDHSEVKSQTFDDSTVNSEAVDLPTVNPPKKNGDRIRYTLNFLCAIRERAATVRPEALSLTHGHFEEIASTRVSKGSLKGSIGGRVSRTPQHVLSTSSRASKLEQNFQQELFRGFTGGIMPSVQALPNARSRIGPQISSSTGLDINGVQAHGSSSVNNRGYREGRKSSRSDPPPKPKPTVILRKSANAWFPHNLTKRNVVGDEEPEATKILRKVKSLLNKLTLKKFDSLSKQIRDVAILNKEILEGLIDCIIDHALDEPIFCVIYAQLCSFLNQNFERNAETESWIVFNTEVRINEFSKGLLNRCQKVFQSGNRWAKEEDEAYEARKDFDNMTAEEKEAFAEAQYKRDKLKARTLGNIKFIGELFKESFVTEKIMHECITQLLRNHVDPVEEEIESLCKLLTSIGEQLDTPKDKELMDVYFTQLLKIGSDNRLSSRIRFMVQDVIDMREREWQARQQITGRGGSTKSEKVDYSKFGLMSSAVKKDTDPTSVRLGSQFSGQGAKGWASKPKGADSGIAMARTPSNRPSMGTGHILRLDNAHQTRQNDDREEGEGPGI